MFSELNILFLKINICLLPAFCFSQENASQINYSIVESLISSTKSLSNKRLYKEAVAKSNELALYGKRLEDTNIWLSGIHRTAFYTNKLNKPLTALQQYINGIKLAKTSENYEYTAKFSLNSAIILNNIGDYKEAQKIVIAGIEAAQVIQDSTRIQRLYNLFANVASNNYEFEHANYAYLNALKYVKNDKDAFTIKNNIGVNLKDQGKFLESIEIYESLLQTTNISSFPKTKAMVMSNLGYSSFKSGNRLKALPYIIEAQKTRETLNDWSGLFASYIHLTSYFHDINNTEAIKYAVKALDVAIKKTKSPVSEKEALLHLITLQAASKKKIDRFVTLSDSIVRAKQKTINDYTSAKFQTKERELEIAQQQEEIAIVSQNIAEKEKREVLIIFLLISAILIGYILFRKFQKEKKDRKIIEVQKDKIEILQRELHHRLKNNLSFIDLFISLAKEKFDDPIYLEKLNDLQNRISSMFVVHQQLFKTKDVTLVNANSYLTKLLNNIKQTYPLEEIFIKTEIDNHLHLETDASFPIGLIVNEFVTNSIKHAFPTNKKGIIFISLNKNQSTLNLFLTDNGIGLPKDFNVDSLDSFGIDTMKLLTLEYKGSFDIKGDDGVSLTITLPLKLQL